MVPLISAGSRPTLLIGTWYDETPLKKEPSSSSSSSKASDLLWAVCCVRGMEVKLGIGVLVRRLLVALTIGDLVVVVRVVDLSDCVLGLIVENGKRKLESRSDFCLSMNGDPGCIIMPGKMEENDIALLVLGING